MLSLDLMYLLFLQGLRNAMGGALDEVFNSISKFAVDILPILPYLIFWCVDKSWGYRFITTLWSGEVVNGILKLTVCAYRPWIRSDQIEPAGDSKVAATGYSFPSGHSMVATTMYGTSAAMTKDSNRKLAIFCVIMILLTGFSRNFLGVHTPQDVFVGIFESVFLIIVIGHIGEKIKGKESLIDKLTFAGIPILAAVLLYIIFKPYPMDYIDGKLLVDPQVMMNDTFSACGGFAGLLLGSFIERHRIHYEIPFWSQKLPIMSCIGGALIFAWMQLFAPATVYLWFGAHWGRFIGKMIPVLFALTVYPKILRSVCGEKPAETASFIRMPQEKAVARTKTASRKKMQKAA